MKYLNHLNRNSLKYYLNTFNSLNNKYNINNINSIPLNKTKIVSIGYCNIAICYCKLNDFSNALININKCKLITPNWHKIYSTMAELYIMQNDLNKSIKFYNKAIKLCNDFDSKNRSRSLGITFIRSII